MKKNSKIVWASVFVATMMMSSFVVVTATVKADPPIPKHFPPPIKGPALKQQMPTCDVLWDRDWSNGEPSIGEAGRITTDPSNNIYVVGCDNLGQAVVLKYYPDGTQDWVNHPTNYDAVEDLAVLGGFDMGKGQSQSQYQHIQESFLDNVFTYMLWDVAYSPVDDTVVSCGWATIEGIDIVFASKNDAQTGTQLWRKRFSFIESQFGLPMAAAITVNTDGDIFVSGTVIQLNDLQDILSVNGLFIKIGQHGLTRDVQIDESPSGSFTVYDGIDIGADGNVVMTGYQINTFFTYKIVVVKRNPSTSDIIDSNIFNIDMFVVHMIIDKSDDKIYVCGGHGDGGPLDKAMIVCITSQLTLAYQYITLNNDFYQDITVKDARSLLTASLRQNDQYTITLNDKLTGHSIVKWEIGEVHDTNSHVITASGITTDLNTDIIACGGFGVIDTIKCAVTTQPYILWQT